MKVGLLSALAVAFTTTTALVDSPDLAPRALPNSPKGYTPSQVNCPGDRPTVRVASSLSQNETSWLKQRRPHAFTAMRNFLNRVDISGFDVESYFSQNNASMLPNIGIVFSGGGWRAMLNGAGALQAFDSRTINSTKAGHLGGLLQSSTYMAGLSGGSWLVGSIFMNNFSTVGHLRDDPTGSVWQFDRSVLQGPESSGLSIFNTVDYYSTIADQVDGKEDAGFHVTITDVWGRGLSYQFIDSDGGPKYTWSSIALADNFKNGETPFPVVIANEREPGSLAIASNTTIYEFNPFEMGSWDPTSHGFVPTQYLGSNFTAGAIPSNDKCVVGFDNAGFVMGTSSSLFNQILLNLDTASLPAIVGKLLTSLLTKFSKGNEDIADYHPNPFYQYNVASNPSASNTTLHLVDGAEDNQNIPFHPLIQPVRAVDVIFAVDSSADTTYYWPNGTSLVQTYQRNLPAVSIANGTRFPYIPDTNTIINLGLNSHPSFFGCNASNVTNSDGSIPPLIVYLPYSPYNSYTNVSTLTLKYNDTFRDATILNGYNVATMGNGTLDEQWPVCVGCALLSRSLIRTGTTIPDACTQCFTKYCWDGTLNATEPNPYEPKLALHGVNL